MSTDVNVKLDALPGLDSDALPLEVKDLHVEFRTRNGIARAVNGVSFSLRAGETRDWSVLHARGS